MTQKTDNPGDLTVLELIVLLAFIVAVLAFFWLPLFGGPR
jgi:hypothetical protein